MSLLGAFFIGFPLWLILGGLLEHVLSGFSHADD